MKKSFLLTAMAVVCMGGYAQKTVNVQTAGTLGTLLTETEQKELTQLIITGELNSADVKILRAMTKTKADRFKPVSYTHLDVYKRQEEHQHDPDYRLRKKFGGESLDYRSVGHIEQTPRRSVFDLLPETEAGYEEYHQLKRTRYERVAKIYRIVEPRVPQRLSLIHIYTFSIGRGSPVEIVVAIGISLSIFSASSSAPISWATLVAATRKPL